MNFQTMPNVWTWYSLAAWKLGSAMHSRPHLDRSRIFTFLFATCDLVSGAPLKKEASRACVQLAVAGNGTQPTECNELGRVF